MSAIILFPSPQAAEVYPNIDQYQVSEAMIVSNVIEDVITTKIGLLKGKSGRRYQKATTSYRVVDAVTGAETIMMNPCLAGLTTGEVESILERSVRRSLTRRETIFMEGDSIGALYMVVSGTVKLYKVSADGKEQILRIVRAPGDFHSAVTFGNRTSPFGAQTLTPALIYMITDDNLQKLIGNYPQFAMSLIDVLLRDVRHYISLVGDLSFKKASGRLANILLECYRSIENTDSIHLTNQDLAAMTGTVRETVNRALKAMEEKGIIIINGHRISIIDVDALAELAATGDISMAFSPEVAFGKHR